MSLFKRRITHVYRNRRSDICCSSSRDCTNIRIWISKVTNSFFDKEFSTACIFQSPSEISRICASGPWKDYKSSNRVDQVPGKLIDCIWIEQYIHNLWHKQHFRSASEKVLPEIFVVIQSIANHKFIWKDKCSLSWEIYYSYIKLKCIVKITDMTNWCRPGISKPT